MSLHDTTENDLKTDWANVRDDSRARAAFLERLAAALGEEPNRRHREQRAAQLLEISREFTRPELHRLLRDTDLAEPGHEARAWRRISKRRHRAIRHDAWGMRRRLYRESALCYVVETGEGTLRLRPRVDPDMAQAAVAAHREAVKTGTLVKNDVKRRLSRVSVGEHRLAVKEFLKPGPWRRWAADARSWYNTYRVAQHAIPAVPVLAFLRMPGPRGFVIMEDVGEHPVPDMIAPMTEADRTDIVKAAARATAWLHIADLFHKDLKSTNYMVHTRPGFAGTPVTLIDFDAVMYPYRVSLRRRQKNINQFLASLQRRFGNQDAHTFIAEYQAEYGD